MVKLLIEHGSPINAQSQLGFTPLYMASQENKEDIVRYLLEHGADPSLTTEVNKYTTYLFDLALVLKLFCSGCQWHP